MSADNPWTLRDLPAGAPSAGGHIAHGNGLWLITKGNRVYTSASNEGPWAETEVFEYDGEAISGVAFGDGVWAVITSTGEVWTADDPTGSWSSSTGISDADPYLYRGNVMSFYKGEWAVFVYRYATGDHNGYLYVTDDPLASWTLSETFAIEPFYGGDSSVAPGNNEWVALIRSAFYQYTIYSAPTAGGTWAERSTIDLDDYFFLTSVQYTPEGYFFSASVDGDFASHQLWSSVDLSSWTFVADVAETGDYYMRVVYGDSIYTRIGTHRVSGAAYIARVATSSTLAGPYEQQDVDFNANDAYFQSVLVNGDGQWLALYYQRTANPEDSGAGWGLML